jgi:hypothetical protein
MKQSEEKHRQLFAALNKWLRAKHAHDEAWKNFEGYSWDYYGGHLIDAMNEAEESVENLLEEYVKERITELER